MKKLSQNTLAEKKATSLLADRGLKKTRQRLSILNLLLSSTTPLSHQEISKKIPWLDKVTVYRVLSSFLEKNIAHRIETQDHTWHFAVCPCGHTAHCHPHFSCRKCGRVECLSDMKLPVWGKPKNGYRIENQEIYLHGLCVQCSAAG
jgi:Fur family transcriptional regulator, ferric uptake regulator